MQHSQQLASSDLTSQAASALIPPHIVVNKYANLNCVSRMPTLAVKLAKESFFGDNVLIQCTVNGRREQPPLPPYTLAKLKEYLETLFIDTQRCIKPEFEGRWSKCLKSIGQACKNLRTACKQPET